MSKAARHRIVESSADDLRCLIRWLHLKHSPEYRHVSKTIQDLAEEEQEATQRLELADSTYQGYFDEKGRCAQNEQAKQAQQKYWKANRTCKAVTQRLELEKEKACKQFDIFMWWNPDDPAVTLDTASCVIGPVDPVQIIAPLSSASLRGNPSVDKEGWLTLKVNLHAPLEKTESLIGAWLRLHKSALRAQTPKKTRSRPDKHALALEVWDKYQDCPNFAELSRILHRKASTVKGQFIRGYVLMNGILPSGPSIKQRRVSAADWAF